MNEQRTLDGKIAVITGGSSGIGLAAAHLFHQHGAQLVLAARDETKLQQAATALPGALTVTADLSTLDGINHLIQTVDDQHGYLDVLFANAGAAHTPDLRDTDEKAFAHYINTNVKSAFFTITRSLDLLNDQASVILTSSAAHSRGALGDPLYTLTKAAVASMARTFAADPQLLARGIRVNSLSPGPIRTPLTAMADPAMAQAMDDYITATVPMRRMGTAEEAARAALYLAGSDSTYTTGSDLPVDGGLAQI
ncbi:SDR family NAD(P)-dependent oxidoreductase [Streptomyces sp. NPDC101455]|uniref:SDR family NAD(P)-dependent oxidoreductase n=1 Tax=Streptomyces sp. NPDC101455 TaxID=3366142 RepID=UPI0037FB4133